MRNKVLVVDDDVAIRFGIVKFLQTKGFDVAEAGSCAGAIEQLHRAPADVAILDYTLPDGSAFDLLAEFKAVAPNCSIVLLTAHGSIDLAVKSLQEGADHFLTKPVELPALHLLVERLIENQRNRQKSQAAVSVRGSASFDPFIGSSRVIRELADQLQRVRMAEVPILIEGETGSGKGVLAAWLHRNGPRADEPFVDLNCAGLSKDLLESELFGHEKGAFTGAVQTKRGLLEIADRGTVFLDEIGDVDLQVQPRLLKVLEERRFRRLGETRDRFVDIRLISATHRDLPASVSAGSFRGDLFFRVSTVVLRLPPLRDRAEDIPLIAQKMLEATGRAANVEISPAAHAALRDYRWPGNLRELRNVIERALLLADGGLIEPQHLHFHFATGGNGGSSDYAGLTLLELERTHILRVLESEGGSVERAALRLGVQKNTLYYKLKKHRIELKGRVS